MNECRICFEEIKDDDFLSPCRCNGLVHKECIRNWILSENNNSPTKCEVCLQPYSIDFDALFEELIQEMEREEKEEVSADIEMGASYASIGSEPETHLNQYADTGSHENTRIANRVLRRLLRNNREIKEKTFVFILMGFLFEGFMVFSYYEICENDNQCHYDVVATITSTTIVWVALVAYHIYLYFYYRRLRNDIIRGISI